MEKTIIFSLPGNRDLTQSLARKLNFEVGKADFHLFPDGESYVRINSEVKNKNVILICTLNHPNTKILPLIFMARTLNDLKAKTICLIAPYLPYLRQDKSFLEGEAVTALIFAQLLSTSIDCLLTVEPHLHRIHKLSEIYTIPRLSTLQATPKMAQWIQHHIKNPVLVGPDEASKQWVTKIAEVAKIPYVIGQKKRVNDKQVIVSLPEIQNKNALPILMDDAITTGISMLETMRQLTAQGFKKSICMAVHALFDEQTEKNLLAAGAEQIITCNTVPHRTNKIDIANIIIDGLYKLCR